MKALLGASVAAAALAGACSTGSSGGAGHDASVSISSSTSDATVGDTVTFQATTHDTYGRDAEVQWTTTAGKLSTDQNGRVARVRFEQPGIYSVRSVLLVDGREVDSDMEEVRVRPLK